MRSRPLSLSKQNQQANRRCGNAFGLPWNFLLSLVCTYGDQVVGYAYADRYRTRAAYQMAIVGFSLRRFRNASFRCRMRLVCVVFKILKLQGFYDVFAGIRLPNGASVGLHVKSVGVKQLKSRLSEYLRLCGAARSYWLPIVTRWWPSCDLRADNLVPPIRWTSCWILWLSGEN